MLEALRVPRLREVEGRVERYTWACDESPEQFLAAALGQLCGGQGPLLLRPTGRLRQRQMSRHPPKARSGFRYTGAVPTVEVEAPVTEQRGEEGDRIDHA